MWNLTFTPPEIIEARVLTRLPDGFRRPRRNDWVDANLHGQVLDSFLEGPAFDRAGNLYVCDIPYGRIFRIDPQSNWRLLAEYDGWPNGLALHADGSLWIADYRLGLLRLPAAQLEQGCGSRPETLLGHRNSESFKGLNDLTFDAAGNCYFTDQGQTGLHDPTGRVYRLRPDGRLDLLLANAPSPNGLALSADGTVLFVAVTRGNAIWRAPLLPDGSVSKVGEFQRFFGSSGPDGMAVDSQGRLVVAHASLGGAFVLNGRGEVTHFVRSHAGRIVTNVAFSPGSATLVLTDSQTGSVLAAVLPASGQPLFSHAAAA